jgi:sodium-dependent dicarboxylate transporter 2/3/5
MIIKFTQNQRSKLGLFLGPILFVIILLVPIGEGLPFEARIVLATTIWMGSWWLTEAIPIYVTALLPLVIFPLLHITELGEISANYADRVVFLFLGGFLLAKAVEKSNLHKRFALNILKIFGTNPKYIVAAFMVVTWFLSAWMSNTATTMLMLPIATAVIFQFGNTVDQKRFGTCLMLSIAYSASIGGMATLIGTPPNAIFASLSKSMLNIDISFGQWLLVGLPSSGVSLVVAWMYMVHVGAKITHIKSIIEEKSLIIKQLSELGNISRDERIVAGIFIATAIAWITRGLIWKDFLPMIDDSTIVIASAISLFILPSLSSNSKKNDKDNDKRLLDWDTAVKIPWGVLLLIGGGLALANAFTVTGLDEWIAQQLDFLSGMHYIVIILVIVSVAIFSGEIISNTATAALLIPISASLAISLNIEPLLIMVPLTVATSYGFVMPVGTPPNAIVFASGYVTAAKMARAGLPLDIIGIVMVTLLTSIVVPLVWK